MRKNAKASDTSGILFSEKRDCTCFDRDMQAGLRRKIITSKLCDVLPSRLDMQSHGLGCSLFFFFFFEYDRLSYTRGRERTLGEERGLEEVSG